MFFLKAELDEKVVYRDFRLTSLHGAIEGKTQEKNVKQLFSLFFSFNYFMSQKSYFCLTE